MTKLKILFENITNGLKGFKLLQKRRKREIKSKRPQIYLDSIKKEESCYQILR